MVYNKLPIDIRKRFLMLSSEIKDKALESGFSSCGIIPASAYYEESIKYWNESTKTFPESKYILDWCCPQQPPENGKSIIVCILRYNKHKIPVGLDKYMPKVYLMSDLYPKTDTWKYPAIIEFETYLRDAGLNIIEFHLPNRWAAVKAGLGKFGRNNFVYDPEHGSYIWIEIWVVDAVLEYDTLSENIYLSECSEDCRKCIEACPTKALSDKFTINRSKCIEHLALHKKTIPSEIELKQMGLWLCGCDVCQDVCPYNKNKFIGTEEIPQLSQIEELLKLENILTMDEETYINDFCPRFFVADKNSIWKWKCNALRAMINTGEKKYHNTIKHHSEHKDVRIKEVAEWGCKIPKL